MLAAACCLGMAAAAPEEASSNVNFVNASGVALELAADIKLAEGKSQSVVIPLAVNSATGHFSQPPGQFVLVLRPKAGVAPAELAPLQGHVQLEQGKMNAFAAHIVMVPPKSSKEGKEPVPVLKLKRLDHPARGGGFGLAVVSLCREPKSVMLGPKQVTLEAGRITEVPGWQGASFEVTDGEQRVLRLTPKSEPDPFLLVLYQDLKGFTRGMEFRYEARN